MNNLEFQVVGIVTGISSKSGKAYTMLHLLGDFAPSSKQLCQGQQCITQYVEGAVPSDVAVGSVVAFDYGLGFGGRPTIVGVHAV
jgi:hypothetical protein